MKSIPIFLDVVIDHRTKKVWKQVFMLQNLLTGYFDFPGWLKGEIILDLKPNKYKFSWTIFYPGMLNRE